MITTLEELLKIKYKVPANLDELDILPSINGYEIAKELGFDLMEWGIVQLNKFRKINKWELKEYEVLLMIFYLRRVLYFTGFTYHEYDSELNSLLEKLKQFVN